MPATSIAELERRVGRSENIFWVALGLLALVGSGWMGWITLQLGELKQIKSDIAALKQNRMDHGESIVSQISQPSNNRTFVANLDLAAAQIRVAAAEGHPPDSLKLTELKSALQVAAKAHPDVLPVWQTAAELVTYESHFGQGELRDAEESCNSKMSRIPGRLQPYNGGPTYTLWAKYDHCTFQLDDVEGFMISPIGREYQRMKSLYPGLRLTLQLRATNTRVTYHGGPLVPFRRLIMDNCRFDLQSPSAVPDLVGQLLTAGLLGDDLNSVNVSLSSGLVS